MTETEEKINEEMIKTDYSDADWAPIEAENKILPAESTNKDITPAGFWVRFLALLADEFILFCIYSLFIVGSIAVSDLSDLNIEAHGDVVGGFVILTLVFISILKMWYYTFWHGYMGQTIGKMLVNVKVVCENYSDISYGRALLRYCSSFLSNFFMAGYLLVCFNKNKAALHDVLAGTRVISL